MVGESQDATESRSHIYTDTAMQITGWVTISLIKWKPIVIVFTLVVSKVVTAVISIIYKPTARHYSFNRNTPGEMLHPKS